LEIIPIGYLDMKAYNQGAGAEAMILPVDVGSLDGHHRGLLTDEYPGRFYGNPVVVFDGVVHETAELGPGTTVTVTWHRIGRCPWTYAQRTLIEKAIDAGYVVRVGATNGMAGGKGTGGTAQSRTNRAQ